jgi:DNA modification methylase
MNEIDNIFNTSVRISDMDPMHEDAIWPSGAEICITKVPIRKKDGYKYSLMEKLAKKLKSSMVKNGAVFIVCYAPSEAKSRPFEIAKAMVEAGFTHIDNIIIQRSWFPGKRSETSLVNTHEYVLWFCNGSVWNLDREPVKRYLKLSDDITCCGNTWQVETGSLDEAYSVDLAELLIKMTDSLPSSLIFSPYMSTSSVLKSAIKLGYSFSGFETDPRKIKQYKKILQKK